MLAIARSAPHLSALELDGVRLITPSSIRALVDYDIAQKLTVLSLDGEGLDDTAVEMIGRSARALTALRVRFNLPLNFFTLGS